MTVAEIADLQMYLSQISMYGLMTALTQAYREMTQTLSTPLSPNTQRVIAAANASLPEGALLRNTTRLSTGNGLRIAMP